jgi:hypothetical protein
VFNLISTNLVTTDTDQVTITLQEIHRMEAYPGVLMRVYIEAAEKKAGRL